MLGNMIIRILDVLSSSRVEQDLGTEQGGTSQMSAWSDDPDCEYFCPPNVHRPTASNESQIRYDYDPGTGNYKLPDNMPRMEFRDTTTGKPMVKFN